ncbi:hypothetical protein AZ09_05980 [Acetobacter aceti 1023]|nr:hypothetical protein AZ09_05980 [Acetobacter aceti 1023]
MTAPSSDQENLVRARATAIELELSSTCLPGVLRNSALLAHYAKLVEQHPLPDTCEPAYEYVP